MNFTNRLPALAATVALTALLVGCGGGGGSDSVALPPPPVAVIPMLQPVGAPADGNTVVATECAAPAAIPVIGKADSVRYPKTNLVFRGWPTNTSAPGPYGSSLQPLAELSPLQLRADRAGGFIVSHWTDANGAMFKVAANGDKSVLPIPYSASFDVAADGSIWFLANGALSMATPDGKVTQLATLGGSIAAAADGPLGASPLGPVTLVAAGRDKVYLLAEETTLNTTGLPSPIALTRSLRVLSRSTQAASGWVVTTAPLWSSVRTVDVVSAMRVDANDQLVVLANEPFKQIASQTGVEPYVQSRFAAEAWVRIRDPAGIWVDVAGQAFELTGFASGSRILFYTIEYSLDAKDLAVAPNGDIWVGGAGATFKVSRELGWQRTGRSPSALSDQIGLDGALAGATFASANQLVADNAGVTFYDGETCQIRRLTDTQIATLSGPRLGGVNFASAGFLGQDQRGDLLLARGAAPENSLHVRYTPGVDAIDGRYQSHTTLLKANLVTPSFKAEVVKSLAALLKRDADCVRYFHPFAETVVRCTGAVEDRSAQRGIWLGSGTSGILARINNDLVEGLDGGSGTVISSTTAWPGILNGDAPSGPSGVHVDGSKFYLFGWMRPDAPVAFGRVELRLYQVDTQSSAVTVVAGGSIASGVYPGLKVDLRSVIPSGGGGPAFVQHRSDGKFWLSNGKEIWLLDSTGQLKRIAGLATSGAGVDGAGDAASFALISSMRVLPDNRLLVVDQGAHAIRLLGDDGKVSTIVGTLNTRGTSFGALPALLDAPVDVFAIGADVYITTQTSRNLLLANGVLK